jgi:EAL domain-containing protein (putative c-di-GMP-specific phosphodiesterase class I)
VNGSSVASSHESSALLHTLVGLGKTLNLKTLAEGIEAFQRQRDGLVGNIA